jgi:ribosomal protein S18 acetylase RimI-like enzyme
MTDKSKHPQHDQVAKAVRGWFRDPFESMGYRSEVRTFGTYWNTRMVFPSPAAVTNLADFLADLRAYYGQAELIVCLDDSSLERQLRPALTDAGWSEGESEIFLAHTGPIHAGPAPETPGTTALEMEPATEENLRDFALTTLIAFEDAEAEPDGETLAAEMARRREELVGNARGLLARVGGEPAGILRWFEEVPDIWITGLAVRPAFRRQGIGSALLKRRLVDSYADGRRSVIINVAMKNDGARRLYGRLGFADEVYRRIQLNSLNSSRPTVD